MYSIILVILLSLLQNIICKETKGQDYKYAELYGEVNISATLHPYSRNSSLVCASIFVKSSRPVDTVFCDAEGLIASQLRSFVEKQDRYEIEICIPATALVINNIFGRYGLFCSLLKNDSIIKFNLSYREESGLSAVAEVPNQFKIMDHVKFVYDKEPGVLYIAIGVLGALLVLLLACPLFLCKCFGGKHQARWR